MWGRWLIDRLNLFRAASEEPACLSAPPTDPVKRGKRVNTATAVAPTQPYGWGSSSKRKGSTKITNDLIAAPVLFP